ncbi:hypothetical protein [Paenibacillus harenae]|uniref:Phosphoglycerol transferase MdoB-like AlkP superfamily enzyme n=1 Tax=Paenibacillus harenae TaxID=306543 RepID=A0ABT9U1N9_PAEHA|nr:hypothetical protein [Paenibacillus harenae]MDQ0113551.1 phosphoglycerol transferase MdoB-like AlkP superfamily enzyme [Paenibacillus harenae]
METAVDKYALFKRSARNASLVCIAYSLVTNAVYFASYYSSFIIDYSYYICFLLAAVFAVPVIWLFRGKHWYFPVFIAMLWIPVNLVIGFAVPGMLPEDGGETGDGLALFFFFILNLVSVACGTLTGMIVNGILFFYRKLKSNDV